MIRKATIKMIGILMLIIIAQSAFAQQPALQYFRAPDQRGLNVFETPKQDSVEFDNVKVRIGGGLALQFQSLSQSNNEGTLAELGSDFTLPTANLNIDVQLADGVRMHLRTYFSSRHHNEAWVKGGYLQIDKLDFIKPGFLEGLMQYTTIRVGLDEFNYGDTHFKRSDNAQALYNPFVENFIMDAFSTEAFGEVNFQRNGGLLVLGVTNGKLNQSVVTNDNADNKPSFFGKLGYDKQLNEDLRVRLTGSWYINHGRTSGTYLYGGDRAGCRYYNVLQTVPDANGVVQGSFADGRYNAKFTKINSYQINPFIKFRGLEVFGVYEIADGSDDIFDKTTGEVIGSEGKFTQVAGELVYRFGANERYYVGGRYNTINGAQVDDADDAKINRVALAAGWYLTKNILAKVEYVDQEYVGSGWTGRHAGAQFDGIMFEAVIGF